MSSKSEPNVHVTLPIVAFTTLEEMRNSRRLFFSFSLVLVFLAGAIHWTQWATDSKAVIMMASYVVLFFGFIGAWLSFPNGMNARQKAGLILLISLLARILIMGMPASDDIYRYLWEGKIITAGESPYQYPADHAHYAAHRDHFWAEMNHKDKLTAYPPLSELMFAGVTSIAYSPWAFKTLFILADLCVVWVLIAILALRGADGRAALLYALNPLTLFAIAGEAHFDVLLILAMMLSLFCVEKKAFPWAWIWLSIAIQIKIIAVVLIPIFLWRCQWRYAWLLLIPLVLPSLYFLDSLPGLFEGLWAFGGMNAFNGPIHGPVNYILGSNITWASRITFVLFALVTLWILWAIKTPTKAAYILIASLVLLSPVVHYWYILWVIPFVVLYPSMSWLVLSLSSSAYFASTFSVENGEDWSLPIWAMWLMWLPFLLVLTYELRMTFVRKFKPATLWDKPETLAIVVPTLNECSRIEPCLSALTSLDRPPDEIIVSDGGSTDHTATKARAMGFQVVSSTCGRGAQIRAGVEATHSDVVLVIHADCICASDVSQRVMTILTENPDVVGGAIGQRFRTSNHRLLIIEMLNDARATLGSASFGDQGQFFRTMAARNWGGFPDYPLMEDIELSLRMMQTGRVVLLGEGIKNSARQWDQNFIKRILLILKLVIVFRLNRLFKRDVTKKLYAMYYTKKLDGSAKHHPPA
jgi:Glycosyl transferase family 2/Glycosyltransferase family 87